MLWEDATLESFVGIIIYTVLLILGCYFFKNSVQRQCRGVLIVYLLILCALAFICIPGETSDFYRLRQYILDWVYLSWGDMIKYAFTRVDAMWVLYSYVLYKLGGSSWIPAVTCLIGYGCFFYIISSEVMRLELNSNSKMVAFMYLMGYGTMYISLINGIRNTLGFAVVAYCLYCDTVEHKGFARYIVLYIFAGLIHPAVLVVVLSRVCFLILQCPRKYRIPLILAILLAGVLALKYCMPLLKQVYVKAMGYINANEYEFQGKRLTLLCMTQIVQVIIVLAYFKLVAYARMVRDDRISTESVNGYKSLWLFCLIWTIISLVALPISYNIFYRYSSFVMEVSIPLTCACLRTEQGCDVRHTDFPRISLYASVALYIMSITIGSLHNCLVFF